MSFAHTLFLSIFCFRASHHGALGKRTVEEKSQENATKGNFSQVSVDAQSMAQRKGDIISESAKPNADPCDDLSLCKVDRRFGQFDLNEVSMCTKLTGVTTQSLYECQYLPVLLTEFKQRKKVTLFAANSEQKTELAHPPVFPQPVKVDPLLSKKVTCEDWSLELAKLIYPVTRSDEYSRTLNLRPMGVIGRKSRGAFDDHQASLKEQAIRRSQMLDTEFTISTVRVINGEVVPVKQKEQPEEAELSCVLRFYFAQSKKDAVTAYSAITWQKLPPGETEAEKTRAGGEPSTWVTAEGTRNLI